jgi:hypothetical protein
MHPIIKVLFGAILLVGGVAVTYQYTLDDFYIVAKGIVPPFIALLGLFIMWLELDELRIEKEMKSAKKKR